MLRLARLTSGRLTVLGAKRFAVVLIVACSYGGNSYVLQVHGRTLNLLWIVFQTCQNLNPESNGHAMVDTELKMSTISAKTARWCIV